MDEPWMWVAAAELAIIAPLVWRLGRGPSVSDRIVALNTISTQATLAVLALALAQGNTAALDVSIWLASFSYLGTFVWARLLERDLL
jgi:multicomponent Na+:H+ antiporter subunit F